MITLPPPFVAIKYPGYFWNTEDKQLYSIKVSGELRPLKLCIAYFNNQNEAGYNISVEGQRLYVWKSNLMKLTMQDSVIPYHQEKPKVPVRTNVRIVQSRRGKYYPVAGTCAL
jgi:hypothetical protein